MYHTGNLNQIKNASFQVIPSDGFEKTMKEVVHPFLESRKQSIIFERDHDFKLYCEYYYMEEERGTILISHGFSESHKKYREMIYYMLRQGYSVCIFDHRGHGHSRRDSEVNVSANPTHIERFSDYVAEMDYVVRNVMMEHLPKPYYLYCHSMGGAVGALYLENYPYVFEKAVLNAPMFEINRGGIPYLPAKLVVNLACLFGFKNSFMMGMGKYSSEEDFEHSADTCYERYLYYLKEQQADPKIQSGGPTFQWVKESFKADEKLTKPANVQKIKCPVLLFQAESDDFVLPGGHAKFMEEVEHGRMIFVTGSKHEIYCSDDQTMQKYLHVIFDFLSMI
ncbi:MAG: alpha/beta hydrolase [Dorea sp.]|nr:alpha/beta hydrolase [Dorea sp.]